jgi:hypothetical protein
MAIKMVEDFNNTDCAYRISFSEKSIVDKSDQNEGQGTKVSIEFIKKV